MALRVPEMFFWLAKIRKSLSFLRCISVSDLLLKYCSDMKETGYSFSFFLHCVDGYSCLVYWNEFFFNLCFSFRIDVLSSCCVTKTFAIGIRTWFDPDWFNFGVSCRNMPRFVDVIYAWTDVCMSCSILILFGRYQIFSIVSLREFLVCSVSMLVLFSYRIL